MKIITASKFYYHRAGLESYLFKISNSLKQNGHEVIPFSTKYSKNIKTPFDDFFTDYIELGGNEDINFLDKLKALSRIFYNFDAADKFRKLIDYTNPDLVWGFGVHRHLSPSIFIEAKKRSIPVIHRLSDYALICPDSRLTKGDDSTCDLLCPLKGYHNAIINQCVRQSSVNDSSKKPSVAASTIGALELFFHNKLGLYKNNVDKFIAPSLFLKNVMIKSGMPEEKIVHIPIFIDPTLYTPNYNDKNYLVYFGRLSREKGLPLLLNAMSKLKNYKLIIVGDGPQRDYLEKIKEEKNLFNVVFTGLQHGDELNKIVANSRFVVVPSIWYDNSPNVIFEANAMGKPVLGANIGGIPEYINENIDGCLYKYNDEAELVEKIDFLMTQTDLCKEMGKEANKKINEHYNPEIHYSKIQNLIYSL